MAQAPTTAPKAKRKSGPRVSKDKTVFMLFEGNITNMHILHDPLAALDMKEAQPNLTYKKVTIPAKKVNRPAANGDTPAPAPTA